MQAYPNGTVVNTTMDALLGALAGHWRALSPRHYLADYGGAPNLLE